MAKFFDTQVERKVLSGMLTDAATMEYASLNITVADFEDALNSTLFDIILRFYRKYHKQISRTILGKWLATNIPKERTQLLLRFTEIETIPQDEYSRYYIEELKSYTDRRSLFSIHDYITDGLNNDIDSGTLFTDLSQMILTTGQSMTVMRTSVFDNTKERIKLYKDKRDYPEKYLGVPYGIEEIDELTGGMFSGQLYMITGRTGAGKCVKFDSKILMLDGSLETIENIVNNKDSRKILTMDNNYLIDTVPTNYMYSGKQQVYKVTTTSGRVIEITNTHPLFTVYGWQPLSNINIGDRLAVPRTLPVFGKSELPVNQVKLLAYLIAEGNLSTSSIGFTNYDVKIKNDFRSIVKCCGIDGISVTTHGNTLPKKKRTLVITGSVLDDIKTEYSPGKFRRLWRNPIKSWLDSFNLLGKKAIDKQLPKEIFKLPEANMAIFLGTVWSCDGSIYGDTLSHITFETGSPALTKGVAHLLLRFGILTRYWEHYTTCNSKKFIVGSLEVMGSSRKRFLEKIGPYFIGQKRDTVKEALKILKLATLNTNVDTIPMSLVVEHLPKLLDGRIDRKKIMDSGCKFEFNYSKDWNIYGICRNKVLLLSEALQNTELYYLATNDIFWDKIKSIEGGDIVDTYDLEVSPACNFIANDILVHNSRMLFNIGCNVAKIGKSVMYCTIEMEAAIIQNMWESRETQISLKDILRARLSPEDEAKYIEFIENSAEAKIPFFIVDIPQGCTTGIIDTEVMTFEKLHGKLPDIVLIDYANLINPVSKYKDRAEKYDHVFRELKEGARAHKLPYYTAAQMNREATKVKEPGTEHVAFSDAASYHCDSVFRVFADKNDAAQHELHFEVIKGRYHETARVTLLWQRDINLIASFSSCINTDLSRNQNVSNYSGSTEHSSASNGAQNEDY